MGARYDHLALETLLALSVDIQASGRDGFQTITYLRSGDAREAVR